MKTYLPGMKEGWDVERHVRIGGKPATRKILRLRPEHVGAWGSSSLGPIRRHDVGRYYVLDDVPGFGSVDVIVEGPKRADA